jgi:hypothetical protein
MVKLKYVAEDGRFYPDVPASDHDQANEVLAERLVDSGLYEFEDAGRQAAAVERRQKAVEEGEAAEAAAREAVAKEMFGEESPEMTVAELRDRANELGLDVPARAKKAEIIKAIEKAEENVAGEAEE